MRCRYKRCWQRGASLNGTCVLRIVDYTGVPEAFSQLGAAVSRLMADCGAEYADCYCWGIPAQTMAEAGFCARTEDDLNIIPNYLSAAALRKYGILFLHQQTRCFHDVQGRRGPGQAQYQGGMTPAARSPFSIWNAMPGRCGKTSAGF